MAAEKDTLFGGLAVERGYLTPEQVDEALAAQKVGAKAIGVTMPLGQLLVAKGFLTPDQVQDLENAVAVKTGEAGLVAGDEVIARAGRPMWLSIALGAAVPVAIALVLVFAMLDRKERRGEGAAKGPPPVRAT